MLIPALLIIFLIFHYKKQHKLQKIYMEELRQSSIHEIDRMNGRQFEEYLGVLYQSLGYHSEVTKGSGDFGADLVLKNNNEKIIVQAKRYKNKVGIQSVQEVVAAKRYYNANHAWVVTNNYFTGPAHKLANANDVLLIDRDLLINLSAQANRQNTNHQSTLESSS
ncbi:endonuclease [Bacillus wiedmannii]|uniref:restriction endonuclease n=1 Tax=Bacillus wiedmannii TaxID=1890302 RepID=UPI000BF39830|nr:restriction endonuclease [Bacillus wiedmannii]PFZ02363.1 endonuclease [Bacillus wiedmannii]